MGNRHDTRYPWPPQGLSKIEGLPRKGVPRRYGVWARKWQLKRVRSGQGLGPGGNGVSAVSVHPRPCYCNLLCGERYGMALDNSRVLGLVDGEVPSDNVWNVPPLPTRLRCVNLIWLSVIIARAT